MQLHLQNGIVSADEKAFLAQAVSTVDFNGDGKFNVWVVDQTGATHRRCPPDLMRPMWWAGSWRNFGHASAAEPLKDLIM